MSWLHERTLQRGSVKSINATCTPLIVTIKSPYPICSWRLSAIPCRAGPKFLAARTYRETRITRARFLPSPSTADDNKRRRRSMSCCSVLQGADRARARLGKTGENKQQRALHLRRKRKKPSALELGTGQNGADFGRDGCSLHSCATRVDVRYNALAAAFAALPAFALPAAAWTACCLRLRALLPCCLAAGGVVIPAETDVPAFDKVVFLLSGTGANRSATYAVREVSHH